ncbi:hypothetical protein AB0B86_10925 [Micromonospora sp. NPDC049047]|uniref:hypothetical protein n=1 Tax=Micromonospora sp. NPDC049047 TaxID=3155645 RepID=UPI0033D9B0B9
MPLRYTARLPASGVGQVLGVVVDELGEGPRLPTDDPGDVVVSEIAPPGTVGNPVLGENLGRPLVETRLEQAVACLFRALRYVRDRLSERPGDVLGGLAQVMLSGPVGV